MTVYYVPEATGWGVWFAGCYTAPGYGPWPYIFTSTNGAITILRYTGFAGSLNIPDMIDSLPVTGIGDSAFYECYRLTNVTVPGSVTSIGTNAFANCYNLAGMTIPDSVTTLGQSAFLDCYSLANITLSTNLTAIDDWTFADCGSLTNLVLSDSVTNIGDNAFYFCQQLTSITLGAKVTSIGTNAFAYCFGLTGVTIPDSVTSIGNSAFLDCSSLANLTLSTNLTAIGDWTFGQCTSLTNLVLPDGVTNIGDNAFIDCSSLTGMTIPDHVTGIGDDAFSYCQNLSAIIIPASVTQLGQDVFFNCSSLTNIEVDPLNPNYAGMAGVLFDKQQTTLIACPGSLAGGYSISSDVTNIQADAFYGCTRLTDIAVPGSVIGIGTHAFGDCSSLTNIFVDPLNPAYASMGGVLFNKDQTLLIQFPGGLGGNYSIPDRVTSIGESAFLCCLLNTINISTGVRNLGDYAFYGCTNLTDFLIPKGVTNIGYWVFGSCNSLTNIAVDPLNPVYSSLAGVLFNQDQTTLIQFPAGLGGTYSMPGSVRNVADMAFYNSPNLTCLIIPDSTASFGPDAFAWCSGLTRIFVKGNAPNDDGSEFEGDFNATLYYQPGTTGWDSYYGSYYDIVTAQWLLPYPLILGATTLGVQNNQFGFTISWATNAPVVVEACTNLADPLWIPVQTNALTTGSAYFSDPQWTNYPGRFYRLHSP
jgi:hypothetical protein